MDELLLILQPYIDKYKQKFSDKSDDVDTQFCYCYPFNEIEYIMMHLTSSGIMTIDEYEKIRNQYLTVNKNLYVLR